VEVDVVVVAVVDVLVDVLVEDDEVVPNDEMLVFVLGLMVNDVLVVDVVVVLVNVLILVDVEDVMALEVLVVVVDVLVLACNMLLLVELHVVQKPLGGACNSKQDSWLQLIMGLCYGAKCR